MIQSTKRFRPAPVVGTIRCRHWISRFQDVGHTEPGKARRLRIGWQTSSRECSGSLRRNPAFLGSCHSGLEGAGFGPGTASDDANANLSKPAPPHWRCGSLPVSMRPLKEPSGTS